MSPKRSAFETEIRNVLTEVRADLKEHMRRTEALEKFQARWSGAFIALTGIGSLGGFAFSVIKIVEFFSK